MLLWIGLALMSAGVLAALLRPLLAKPTAEPDGSAPDAAAIYRDQLTELDGERERGLIQPAEHEAARAEIARRLIASADETSRQQAGAPGLGDRPLQRIALAVAVAVPLAAMAIYLPMGQPGMPGQPVAARKSVPIEGQRVEELIRAVETRLRQKPEDGEGWDVIGPVYLKQGRFREAADAFARASRILGPTARRLAGFAEATVLASDGIVTEPARQAYEQLAKLEPQRPEPRFWLALAKEQDGRLADAAADYAAMIASAPPDATWRPLVAERLDDVRRKLGQPTPAAKPGASAKAPAPSATSPAETARGPSADDVKAAEALSAGERQQLIEGMVKGLAERLRTEGRDLAGWQRLIRAYSVMGRESDARQALGDARRNFNDEPQSLAVLRDLARALGLES